jgi:hypothetical protein
MKHIFYIHSHITYILSMSVLQSLELPHQDVLFLYGRGFKTTDTPPVRVRPLSPSENALGKLPSYGDLSVPLRYLPAIRPLDIALQRFARDDCFTAYLPLTKSFLTQLIASHRKCSRICILEEGLLTYTGNFLKIPWPGYDGSWIGRLKRTLKFPFHLNRSVVYNTRLLKEPERVFVLFPDLMPLGRFPVERPRKLYVPPVPEEFVCDGGILLVLGPIAEGGPVDASSFSRVWDLVCSRMAHMLANRVILIKFHPDQTPTDRQLVLETIAKNDVPAKVVPQDVSAEAIALRSPRLSVCGFHSSLLFYAARWGCESISLIKLLTTVKPDATAWYKSLNLPSFFWSYVTLLEP